MKKFAKSILGISAILFVGISFCLGVPFYNPEHEADSMFPFDKNPSPGQTQTCDDSADLGNCPDIKDENSILNRLLDIFNIDVVKSSDHKFLNYVKAILNIALGLVSMVAFIMTIYTFYLMFFTENEAGAKKAKGNLVGIFIALAIIGLSWLIVSCIFRWYQAKWKDNQNYIGNITMVNHGVNSQIYLTV